MEASGYADISIDIEAFALDRCRAGVYLSPMSAAVELAEIGALIGDPARANMLCALLDGVPHDATELALKAGISPPTASWHLGNLINGQLLVAEKCGRRRLFRLASPVVARVIEAALILARDERRRRRLPSKDDEVMRSARTCYDHIAGRLGVALTDALVKQRRMALARCTPTYWNVDGGKLTAKGKHSLCDFGIEVANAEERGGILCHLDWTERRPHIAGTLGTVIAERAFELGWIERVRDSFALSITARGKKGFAEVFEVRL
jgi:DNA-binding transcriptional ArsR family regulator